MASRTLTRQQISRLGGLAAAASLTDEERSERGRRAVEARNARFGSEAEKSAFYTRMAHKRHGRLR